MLRIPRTSIIIAERQRSIEPDLRNKGLYKSITEKGLLHPIVVTPISGDKYQLVAGERRLSIIDWIAEEKGYFMCHGETILPGEVPITLITSLSEYFRAEYDENVERKALTWEEQARALDKAQQVLASLGKPIEIARELISRNPGTSETAQLTQMRQARVVVPHLSDPAIKNARSITEAYSLVVQKEEAAFTAELIRRKQLLPAEIRLFQGDMFLVLPTLEASTVDLILADPPYGQGVGDGGFRSRTVHHHNYDDSVANARRISTYILSEGFRLTKPRANLFMFCYIDHWDFLQQQASAAGWVPFGTPIIWAKSDSEGLAPWGRQGPRRTYELIFFATKGQKGLIRSPVDILRFNRVAKNERDYGAAKPPFLMRELIECSTIPNDLVLDPCCGSGSTLVAAKASQRRGIGVELDSTAFNLAYAKLGETHEESGKMAEAAMAQTAREGTRASFEETKIEDL